MDRTQVIRLVASAFAPENRKTIWLLIEESLAVKKTEAIRSEFQASGKAKKKDDWRVGILFELVMGY